MTLDEFKVAIHNTVEKIIAGIQNHPKASAQQKQLNVNLFSTLQESIPQIKNFPQIMKFYRTLFIYLETLGNYADANSKQLIAERAVNKIKELFAEVDERIVSRLNDVNDELLMADQLPRYFRGLCYSLKTFFENKIAENELIDVYLLTLWAVKNKPEMVNTILAYKKAIIDCERKGDEAEDTRQLLDHSILPAKKDSGQQDSIDISRDYVIARFFRPNSPHAPVLFKVTEEEAQKVELVAPIFLQ